MIWSTRLCVLARGLLGLLLATMAAGLPAPVLARESITVAVTENSPPLVFRNPEGQLQGLRVDMWSLWEAQTGIKVHLRLVDWSTAKSLLIAGQVDAIDIVSSAVREGEMLSLSDAYMPSNLTLYYHKSISGIVDAKSSRGFLVGVRGGGGCIPELQAGGSTNLMAYPSFEALVDAALQGDIRVFCLPDQQAGYLLNHAGRADDFRHSPPLRSITLHWAVRKDNDAMRQMIAAGYARIAPKARQAVFDRWLGSTVGAPPAYLRHLAKALVATAIAFTVLLAWLWTLRRSVKHRTADLLAAQRALATRVREQACLHAVFKASEDLHIPLRQMLQAVCAALQTGSTSPAVAGVEVDWDGQHYASGDIPEPAERLSAPLQGHGQLTLAYHPVSSGSAAPGDEARGFVALVAQRLATVFERRTLQDERRELDRQMFQMEKLTTIGELTMGLAHEIGNPLGGMKAVAQSLQLETTLPADVHEDLARLEAEIDRLASFLRSFHGYAAQQAPAPEACALDRILEDVLFWTRRDARCRQVRFAVVGVEALPPLRADRHQLKQVLLNLVMNAIQVQPDGGTVTIRAQRAGNNAQLEVIDSGPGIAPALLPRIFEPFFTTRRDGSGLGLPIVRKIVEDHGGTIAIASEPGHGTHITLTWPLAEEDNDTNDSAR